MILAPFKRIRTEEKALDRETLDRVQDAVAKSVDDVRNILNRGIRRSDNLFGQLLTQTVVVPDDWVALTLQNSWTRHPDFGFLEPAQRKAADGRVFTRGLIQRIPGVPAIPSDVAISAFPASSRGRITTNGATIDIRTTGATLGFDAGSAISFLDTVQYDASDRAPANWTTPVALTLDATFPGDVAGLHIVSAVERDTKVRVSGVVPRWTSGKAGAVRTVSVKSLSGLVVGKTYDVTFFVEAG